MQQALVAGDTLKFTTSVPEYPASEGWTLNYYLIPRTSGARIDFTAIANGDDYDVEVPASTTADWAAGEYSWAAEVVLSGEKYTVDGWTSADGRYRGGDVISIKPDPRVITAFDNRSSARKILDGLLALYETHASGQGLARSYTIAGRSMEFRDAADLIAQIRFWKAEVAKEERAERIRAGLDSGGRLLVRF
jgi:hypothetical protein